MSTPWNTVVVSRSRIKGRYCAVMFNEQDKYVGISDRLAVGIKSFSLLRDASREADRIAEETGR